MLLMLMLKKKISKEEINNFPLVSFQGKVNLITNNAQCKTAVSFLKENATLGFDTETKPSFKKGEFHPVCLLQLSTEDEAFLFRFTHLKLNDPIKELLTNPNIVKTGVAIRDDIIGLKRLSHFEAQGFIEISDLAKKVGITQLGLQSLTAILLNRKLSKKNKLTNWEKEILSDDQMNYAATDAWISREIYLKLKSLIPS